MAVLLSSRTWFSRPERSQPERTRREDRHSKFYETSDNLPDRAREAIARVLPLAGNELKAGMLYLSGVIESRCGSLPTALTQLLEGAELTNDSTLLLELLTEASQVAAFQGRLDTLVELGERGESLPAVSGRERVLRAVLTGFALRYSFRHEQAHSRLAEVVPEAAALDGPRELVLAAMATSIASDLGTGLPYANRAVETARRHGLLADLAGTLEWQAFELHYASSFEHAYAAADEGYRLSLDVGRVSAWQLNNLAAAEAHLGRTEDARRHAEEAISAGRRMGSNFMTGYAEWTLAFIDLSTGRPAEALDQLLTLTSLDHCEVNPMIGMRATPDTIEAAARCGRADQLCDRWAMFERWSRASPTEQRQAMLAQCQALLGIRPPEEAFEDALARSPALSPMQRARTELLFGEWLRRERRRQEARTHLRSALELFRELGTRLFAERAEGELRATGETARKRDPSTLDDLTPQEFQIAGLVAKGLTNREIAAQLFLSPRTIDYHLRKVFSKLGIASRTELVRDGLPSRVG
ncbi:MAG: LuxR C-terminal-related transcriptional regulator [Solirubrobacteraceae bacterium]